MEYTSTIKNVHRAGIVALSHQSPQRPIAYLDGGMHEATSAFINTWNVPQRLLVPINRSKDIVDAIRSKWPRVRAVAEDIDRFLFEQTNDSLSVVWLDYMCRFDADYHTAVMREALRVAPFATLTFSLRAVNRDTTVDDVLRGAKKAGIVLERPSFYKGKSDIENMMRLTITRGHAEDEEDTDTCSELDVDFEFCEGDKVVAPFGDTLLTAVVLRNDSDAKTLVRFDCDAQSKWIATEKLKRNDTRINIDSLLGKELAVPIKIFGGNFCGYGMVKQSRKRVHFKIGKRHRGGERLTIHALTKKGESFKRAEQWTVSPEEASCWLAKLA